MPVLPETKPDQVVQSLKPQIRRLKCECEKWLSITCFLYGDGLVSSISIWVKSGENESIVTVRKRSLKARTSWEGRRVPAEYQFVWCTNCKRRHQVRKFKA